MAFLENNILSSFFKLIKLTEVDIVRLNAHKAIELLSTSPDGADQIVEHGYIPLLIDCARDEVVEIKVKDRVRILHLENFYDILFFS